MISLTLNCLVLRILLTRQELDDCRIMESRITRLLIRLVLILALTLNLILCGFQALALMKYDNYAERMSAMGYLDLMNATAESSNCSQLAIDYCYKRHNQSFTCTCLNGNETMISDCFECRFGDCKAVTFKWVSLFNRWSLLDMNLMAFYLFQGLLQ